MSDNLDGLRKQAEDLFYQKKFKEIIELLSDEILEKYNDAELYAWRSRAHHRLNNDVDKILHFAQKAIDADHSYYMGYLARGNVWYFNGEYDKAIADYNKAIKLKPNFTAAFSNREIRGITKANMTKP